MFNAITKLLLAGVFLPMVTLQANAHDHTKFRGRLIFTDHEQAVVKVLDLDSGKVTHNFSLPKPNSTMTTTEDGRYVIIKTGDDSGTVRVLDTGMIFESHGDHIETKKSDVKMLDLTFTGDRPGHVVSDNGSIAIFYDGKRPWEGKGEAKAFLVDLKSLATKKPKVDEWKSTAPQHGIIIPLAKGEWITSTPNAAYAKGDDKSASSRPNGFEILERGKTWKAIASFSEPSKNDAYCKLFHGYAPLKGMHVFACNEGDDGGLLIISKTGAGNWASRKLPYPDQRRSSTLKSFERGRFLVGNYCLKSPYNSLLRVDPTVKELTPEDVLSTPGSQPACQFELVKNGKQVVNLTPDGQLRVYDIDSSWKEIKSIEIVPPFDCAFDAKSPKSSLAIIGNSAFVSDPLNRRIREFYLESLSMGLDVPIDGIPTNIAAGASGG